VSKLATEYIKEGEPYGTIKKIFSINIVYFTLGQGEDYIYEYKGEFIGIHLGDILQPTQLQEQNYQIQKVVDIFPKYYLLKVNNFDDNAQNSLDEWIYFLKNSEVKDDFKAKGLSEAREQLQEENLSEEDKKAYARYKENRRIERGVTETAILTGKKEMQIEVAKSLILKELDVDFIIEITKSTKEEIENLRLELLKK
jgi:hypothetical protein